MKKIFLALLLALFMASSATAADISTYHVGSMKIVRIVDGVNGVPVELMYGDRDVIRRLVPTGMCPNLITSYVLESKEGLMLIDSGFGDIEPGVMYENFLAAGFNPEDVKTVLLTHLHGDHIGGLMKGNRKVFPNATIYVRDIELAFWKDRSKYETVPAMMRYCFDAVERLEKLYDGQIRTFRDGEKVVPWLTPILAAGHTAGHTMYELKYDGQKAFIWGDIIHCLDVQASHPEITVEVDSNREQAREARMKALELVADTDLPVFGEHFTNPGVGKFYTLRKGSYRFVPVEPASSK